jgi:hypothetical protein
MIVISQPRYLPALTYLQRLYFSDTFVILDNVQRQKRGFENRNKVLVEGKTKWLTIPSKSSSRALIRETTINGNEWIGDHKEKLEQYYSEAPHFNKDWIEAYYGELEKKIVEFEYDFTSSLNYLIKNICTFFKFEPSLVRASELISSAVEEANGPDKIFEISNAVDTDLYVSGMNGREYGILDSFKGSAIDVKFHADQPVPYNQNVDEFVPHLAFFDALFYAGKEWVEEQIKKEPTLEE